MSCKQTLYGAFLVILVSEESSGCSSSSVLYDSGLPTRSKTTHVVPQRSRLQRPPSHLTSSSNVLFRIWVAELMNDVSLPVLTEFSYEELSHATNGFTEEPSVARNGRNCGKVGTGGYGKVFKGVLRSQRIPVAVKCLTKVNALLCGGNVKYEMSLTWLQPDPSEVYFESLSQVDTSKFSEEIESLCRYSLSDTNSLVHTSSAVPGPFPQCSGKQSLLHCTVSRIQVTVHLQIAFEGVAATSKMPLSRRHQNMYLPATVSPWYLHATNRFVDARGPFLVFFHWHYQCRSQNSWSRCENCSVLRTQCRMVPSRLPPEPYGFLGMVLKT